MKNYMVLFLLLLFSACKNNKISQPTPFRFEDSCFIKHMLTNDTVLSITVKLANGVHAYGIGEQVGKPIDLKVRPDGGWKAIGSAEFPQAKLKKVNGLGMSFVLEGEFKVRQKLERGQGPGKALFYLQVCTDSVCDRPRTHEIALE